MKSDHFDNPQIFDMLPVGCFILSKDERILKVNKFGVQLIGEERESVAGHPFTEFVAPASRNDFLSGLTRVSNPDESVTCELLLENQHTKTVFVKAQIHFHEKLSGYLVILSDVSQMKMAEERFQEFTGKLRELSAHIEIGMEAERKRIAREIHDGLGSSLSALKMEVSILRKSLATIPGAMQELSIDAGTQSMSDLIDNMVDLVRKLVSELRPGVLDELGLVAAIRWFARDYQNRTGVETLVNVFPEDFEVESGLSTAVFRIFQEIMTNVSRHAKATRVTIFLRKQDHQFLMRVRDNGIGIVDKELGSKRSFGIIGMQERVRLQGGQIQITGVPGEGTTVLIEIPLGK